MILIWIVLKSSWIPLLDVNTNFPHRFDVDGDSIILVIELFYNYSIKVNGNSQE